MSGRFPGAADIEQFWRNVRDGVESISFFTDEELLASGVDPQHLADPSYVRAGGILDDVESFDAAFFGISPREAEVLDPQHRLFLETVWHALEDAGCDPERYPGRIGVFGGVGPNHYFLRHVWPNPAVREALGIVQVAVGSEKDFLTTRVSYKLNLKGPSLLVQTACSTSLVAVHLACRSLLDGDSDMALAGGSTLPVPQKFGYFYREGGIFSPDGHCRAFDTAARGTVGSSGVAVVVLKRLEDALADGDAVHAVIKGSAINNDGNAKVGFTAPSVPGQVRVIRDALGAAGVHPESIQYIETHGTATLLGDLIEISALKEVFGAASRNEGFCALGSLKTNLGHLDTAAGVAGLIKTVLALRHRQIPPSLHFETPNEKLHLAHSAFYVNAQLRPWKANGLPRRAGVSSFGIGGTNAHVVLEEAPAVARRPSTRPYHLLCLSGRTHSALARARDALADRLERHPEIDPGDAAFTLQVGRRPFDHRWAAVCRDGEEVVTALRRPEPAGPFAASAASGDRPVIYLFPGGGAQFVDMGLEIYRSEALYREQVDLCMELLDPDLRRAVLEAMFPAPERRRQAEVEIERTSLALPALFITEYALARLWMSWGVRPAALIGHSLGEYTAACLAGVLSLEDALALVVLRGHLFERLPPGAMLSVPLPERELAPWLEPPLSVAAVNLPSLSVVSGPCEAIDELGRALAAAEIDYRRIHIAVAAHSETVEPILADFGRFVRTLRLQAPAVPLISNVTGKWMSDEQATDPEYWVRHLRQTVRFAEGVGELLRKPERILLEVGPGRTLSTLVRRYPAGETRPASFTSFRHPEDEESDARVLLGTLGQLWALGVPVDWAAYQDGHGHQRVPLPGYPFERQRFWLQPTMGEEASTRASGRRHGLDDWFYAPAWQRVPPAPPLEAAPAGERRQWLVLSDPLGLGEEVARQLDQLGHEVVRVHAGAGFSAGGDRTFTLDPCRPEDYRTLLDHLAESGGAPRRILHLWSVGAAPEGGLSSDAFERAQERGFYSLLALAQALAEVGAGEELRLVGATCGAAEVTGDEGLRPEQATLEAGLRALQRRAPAAVVHAVDLPPRAAWDGALAACLLAEAEVAAPRGRVALRGGHRWVEGFAPVPLPEAAGVATPLRDGDAYLIVGGLGDLGLAAADALARAVRARLALFDHQELPAERRLVLERLGAEVLAFDVDYTDPAALRGAILEARERYGPLAGVVFAGGVRSFAAMAEAEPGDCERHFRPRVHGLLALTAALQDESPGFCLVLSSLEAVLGQAESLAYGAAHRVLELLALEQNRAGGTRWLSLLWDDAAQPDGEAEPGIPPERGAEVLRRALSFRGGPQLAVSPLDLPARLEEWRRTRPIADEQRPARTSSLHPRPQLPTPYVEPQNERERTLAAIWGELLGLDQIGIHDDFRALGGDSVVAIQVVTRAKQAGIALTQRATFFHPTIAELARASGVAAGINAQQGVVTGDLPLTPIQHWFFERELADPHHWNLPLYLALEPGLDLELVERAAGQLLVHHDALRLRFVREASGWRQVNAGLEGIEPGTRIDLKALPESCVEEAVRAAAAALQPSLNLAQGPLVRIVIFDRGHGRPAHLLLLLHHLVADAISLRLLLEDLHAAYEQLAHGQEISLPLKTTSFRHWAGRQQEQSSGAELEAEMPHWSAAERRRVSPLPVDLPGGENTESWVQFASDSLSPEETLALLHDVPSAYDTEINDALLTALALTCERWTGEPRLLIDLEGHGREPLFPEVDLTRTVGWFTTVFPVLLDLGMGPREVGGALSKVKEQLRAIPRRGIGHGMLLHLAPAERAAAVAALPRAEIAFLYLGQFDHTVPRAARFRPVSAAALGPIHSPRQRRSHLLEVGCRVQDGRLKIDWLYSQKVHRADTVTRLAHLYVESLRSIITHCRSVAAGAGAASRP